MSDAAKCEKCSATTVQHCDENNCGYLGAGNGAPEAPPYDGVLSHPLDRSDPELAVWYGKMPESNGKSNWTAILYRQGGEGTFMGRLSEGITIDRSEYPDRVRYEADRVRHLIGALKDEPDLLAYDDKLRSDYVYPEGERLPDIVAYLERREVHLLRTAKWLGLQLGEQQSFAEMFHKRQLLAETRLKNAEISMKRMASVAEDLLERLVNVTEGSDEPVTDEEISEIKEVLGLAEVRYAGHPDQLPPIKPSEPPADC